jgi:hypothetical protein
MKLKFGYNVAGLGVYVEEQKLPLFMKSVFAGESAQMFTIQEGIKYKDVINIMDQQVYMRANTGCSTFTASGDQVFTQKEISVDGVIHETALCPNDLENYWARVGLQTGQYYDTMAFEQEWSAYYTALINAEVEKQIWEGNKSTGSGNLALVNGILKAVDGDTACIDANVTAGSYTQKTSITASNVIEIFEQMIAKLPQSIEGAEDLFFACSWSTFKKLLSAFRTLNNYYVDVNTPNPYTTGEYTLPTWGIKVKAFKGLTSERIVLTRVSNIVLGTDLKNDFEGFQVWWERKDDKILTRLKYKLGAEIVIGSEVVEYTNK